MLKNPSCQELLLYIVVKLAFKISFACCMYGSYIEVFSSDSNSVFYQKGSYSIAYLPDCVGGSFYLS